MGSIKGMQNSNTQSIRYLVIGHITQDLVDGGAMLGGTASYSALTSHALGQTTAMVTSHPKWLHCPELKDIQIHRKTSQYATTFENVEKEGSRQQIIHNSASMIGTKDIPEEWLEAKIVHLGPVAAEFTPNIIEAFPDAFIGITPQGWMRTWKSDGKIHFRQWQKPQALLDRADAVVFSIEDLQGNENLIQDYAHKTPVLAVTEGKDGARIYWNGDVHHVSAPKVNLVDSTGAGDIFAAVFFSRLYETRNPWEAGEQAVKLASQSVTRIGLAGIPTREEIQKTMVEIIKGS